MGTRLRPLTCAIPKPLLPVWGVPMLERVVEWLRGQGVDDIAVNCHYLHGQIEEWCAANGCRCSHEPEILGTGGALNPLRGWIGKDDFWLVNGDIVFDCGDMDVVKAFRFGRAPQGVDVIAKCLAVEEGPRTIEVEPEHGLVTCWKSPEPGWSGTWTYCGVALLKSSILDYVAPQGFSTIVDAYEKAMMDGKFVQIVTGDDVLWTDAGTVESYISVNQSGEENAFGSIPQLKACKVEGPIEFKGARGSDRMFFKTDRGYAIVYDDAARGENARYASHARWLKERGISVPEVLADVPSMKALVIGDAGARDLKEHSRMMGEERLHDYIAVVEELAKFNALDPSGLELEPPFDARLYEWERGLFAEKCLHGHFGMEMPKAVETELEAVAEKLLNEPASLVHRDFQSSNVIFGRTGFSIIDFQGMRLGAAVYDLASLLYDPYVDLREGERRALAALYAKKSAREDIAEVLPLAAVQRLVQALGAFCRLAAAGKTEFLRHILPALENLLSAADAANLDSTGALAEELIARETKKIDSLKNAHGEHNHEHCACGHDHSHKHRCEGEK